MARSLRCPKCREKFALPESAEVGTKTNCPHCGAKIRLGLEALQGCSVNGYRILKRIGRGAMGAVFRAEPSSGPGDQAMAIKFLSPELRDDKEMVSRFEREGNLSLRLQHPSLVRVHEQGRFQDIPFMRMDLIEGVSLDRILDKSGAMDWQKASKITLQIADVLAYFQDQGVLHRDVKPENILLNSKRDATLIDLGFAKRIDEADPEIDVDTDSQNQLTMAGTALGSPAYMAPEQVLDAQTATHATDCYCLGASFYHMVTGQLPYEGKNAMQTMQQVLSGGHDEPITLRPQLPPRINQLINFMMAPKVSDRPEHMHEVCAILRRLIADPQDGNGLPPLNNPNRGKFIAIAVVVGLVLLGAILAFGLN